MRKMSEQIVMKRTTTQGRNLDKCLGKEELPTRYEFSNVVGQILARVAVIEGEGRFPYTVQEYVPDRVDRRLVLGYSGDASAVYRNGFSLKDATVLATKRAKAIGQRLSEIRGSELVDSSDGEALLVLQ
ncbi:hypothetical protein AUJ84_04355 [Candidatus Pacearchaeota archaeon CG1_02_32_132]|nr:MAG: hypothetical protein AUJ84_04355 [Candidatus Pacearchaeota archaeon CG1_02_32_132]